MTGRTRATPVASSGITERTASDPARAAQWRARLDALTRWCLSELPLTPAVVDALPAVRPTLGDLLRRALSRDGCGVVDLLDALDAATPEARALLGRVVGSDLLLVVVTAREGALVRADARGCRTPDEARALVNAFFGTPAPAWVAEFGAADAAGSRTPLLAWGTDGLQFGATTAAALGQSAAGDITIVLPFLPLDGRPMAVAPVPSPLPDIEPAIDPFAMPAILGGTLRPGAAFLDAPPAIGSDDADAPDAAWRGQDAEDEEGGHEADDEDDTSDESDDEASQDSAPAAFGDPDDEFLAAFAPPPNIRADVADARAGEDHATGVDHGGALDRLRARTSAAVQRVSVLIATDDGVAEHVADAVAWLADASEQELRALARAGWMGDAAADVALTLAEDDPEALDVVQLARRHEAELVVEIDGQAASAWLATHRPDAARRLGTLLQ